MNKKYKILGNGQLRVAVSGKSGCGNTTVSTLLADALNLPCINYTFRNLGVELGLSVKEIVEKAKTDFSYDKIVDTKQIEMARKTSCVLGSRLAIWLLKQANLKVYLYASSKERAKRVQMREGGDIDEIKAFTEMRDAEDTRRYKQLYSIDNDDYKSADLVIDTEKYIPSQIVDMILEELKNRSLIEEEISTL